MKYKRKRLGLAFSDNLLKVNSDSGTGKKIRTSEWADNLLPNFQPSEFSAPASAWRLVVISCLFLFVFFALFLKLFSLQIVTGAHNRQLADYNRIQMRVIHAPRGVIYDRNGKVLAENNPGFRFKDHFISRDEALALEAKDDPNFEELEVDAIRFYPLGSVTAHVLGYVGQISETELKNDQYRDYRLGDRIGRAGIEQVYESTLRGKDGAEIVEVDASGKKLQTLRRIDPIPGHSIYLSLDGDLQKITFTALKNGVEKAKSCCGALVAENPRNGEILALVSWPSFDSNAFTDPKRNEEVSSYFQDPSSPLLNRVISGTYPPGSTFKITTSLAGLASGKINSQTKIEDTGVISLGPYQFANWYFTQYGRKEGVVDLVKALQRSNDIFFYKVGEWVGVEALGETAKKLGFGEKSGIDLPGEAKGLVPDDAWKRENYGEGWYPGDTLHMAIGQGFLLTTPMQILGETAFAAADGVVNIPHLATKITDPWGNQTKEFHFGPLEKNVFKKEDVQLIQQGLTEVPKTGGTAWPFFTFSIPTAGKTGTAEFGDPKNATHAWYTSYAPLPYPQIAMTVLVEAGGEGSSVAAPITKEVYIWYFNPDKNNLKSLDPNQQATGSGKSLGE
ncbi:MAG: penicillin-binding protein 2 [bacterium]|nr:penicillin-binding protein 2 [bacterium]